MQSKQSMQYNPTCVFTGRSKNTDRLHITQDLRAMVVLPKAAAAAVVVFRNALCTSRRRLADIWIANVIKTAFQNSRCYMNSAEHLSAIGVGYVPIGVLGSFRSEGDY